MRSNAASVAAEHLRKQTEHEEHQKVVCFGTPPYAILLATTLSKYIKIIGFDLYGTNQGTTNNIYANTNGYKSLFDEAVDWSYWVYQISKIFEHNPDKKFHLYNEKDWEVPEKWKFDNIKVDILDNL